MFLISLIESVSKYWTQSSTDAAISNLEPFTFTVQSQGQGQVKAVKAVKVSQSESKSKFSTRSKQPKTMNMSMTKCWLNLFVASLVSVSMFLCS